MNIWKENTGVSVPLYFCLVMLRFTKDYHGSKAGPEDE